MTTVAGNASDHTTTDQAASPCFITCIRIWGRRAVLDGDMHGLLRRFLRQAMVVIIATVLLVTACSPRGAQHEFSRSTSAVTPTVTAGGPTTSTPGEAQFLVPDLVGGAANVPRTL